VQIHQKAHRLGIAIPRRRREVAHPKAQTTFRLPWHGRSSTKTKKEVARSDLSNFHSATTTSSDPTSCSSSVPEGARSDPASLFHSAATTSSDPTSCSSPLPDDPAAWAQPDLEEGLRWTSTPTHPEPGSP
jgi:hypothetical protein